MAFTAFLILGIVTYLNVPISLLPDIPIPEITIQIQGTNNSARELENTVVSPIRQQLLQVGKLRDIRSETRDGSAIIRLDFEYGVNTDLAFIEVNEKIDVAMGRLPKDISRPRVVKASATDIPVFNLNLTLKDTTHTDSEFLDLCEFSETIIRRRLEQLPQVAMVDMTGLVNKQVLIIPNDNQMNITGITLSEIETALKNNNVEPGSMTVKDGHYEYNINFSTITRTVEDVRNIYINKNGKIFQLKEIASINIVPEKSKGLSLYNGQRSVSFAIIKQSDENMGNLKDALEKTIKSLEKTYPNVAFNISQNQTELLDYTINNLQQNLILAFIFVCIVSALFLNDIKSPLIIGLSMFISLIISLLFFYLFKVSLNIVSLTGLILALGMMIDNSIIVTDNIGQYRKKGLALDEACVYGTNEVIAPMLSSSLTTISVFVPLIFLSGIAGALFFDQAFSVTVGLLVSYITGIMLLPVLYKLVYSLKTPHFIEKRKSNKQIKSHPAKENVIPIHEKIYHHCIEAIFKHKVLTTIIMVAVLPVCFALFVLIPKEKMPELSQNELMVDVDWDNNINTDQNREQVTYLLNSVKDLTIESSTLIGQQQFLLNRDREKTSSESEIYIKVKSIEDVEILKTRIDNYFKKNNPSASFSFSPAMTIFEKIFVTSEADLTVEFYTKNNNIEIDKIAIENLRKRLNKSTPKESSMISFQKQLNLFIDKQKLLLYNVSYGDVYQALKTGFKENEFAVLRSYQQYLPIILGDNDKNVREVINNTMVYTSTNSDGKRNKLPLSIFVTSVPSDDIKTITSGQDGEFIPFNYYEIDDPEEIITQISNEMKDDNDWEVSFSGGFFSNKKMLSELIVILFISIMLMYFILAAQFESFTQPLIVLLEIPIDIAAALGLLIITGHSLNLMSAIGIVVTCGIIINDSILKVDIMNQLRRMGMPLMEAIHEAGRRRLNAILMTSLTSIVCMAPLLISNDMGSELEKPLAIATIGGMIIGTPVSLFIVPLVYWAIYRNKTSKVI